MGHHCCGKQKVKRGLWSPEEDEKLIRHITAHGHASWSSIPKLAGLQRCGKSCRLRWINYLRPDLKRGSFSAEEEQIIIDVHRILGNRWAQIAKHLPGRTDNEVKNFWNSSIKKKLISQGLDPKTHNLLSSHHRTSNKVTCNLSQTGPQPISVFSINSQITEVSMEMKPPIVTLPPPPPPPPPSPPAQPPCNQFQTTAIPICEYQSPHDPIWTVATADQNSHDFMISFPCISSIESTPISSSSSNSSVNPYGLGLLEENCVWVSSVGPFEAPRVEQMQLPKQENQQREKTYEVQVDKVEESRGAQEADTSFDSSAFDLDFVESTLMSSALLCRDLSSMEDLAWNF